MDKINFCLVSPLTTFGKWEIPGNEVRSWAYAFKGEVYCGTQIHDFSYFDRFEIVMVEICANLIEITKELKQHTRAFVIGLPESEIIPTWGLQALKKYKETLDCLDMVGAINEKMIPALRSFTKTRVEYVGLPYPVNFARQMSNGITRENKNKTIEIGNMATICGLNYNLSIFQNLPYNGVCYPYCEEDRLKIEAFTQANGRLNYLAQTGWQDYYIQHMKSYLGLHCDPRFTLGRFPLDCASANMPFVGTHYSQSANVLYPYTTFYHWELDKMTETIHRLYNDVGFYDKVVNYANEHLCEFDLEITKQRVLNYL